MRGFFRTIYKYSSRSAGKNDNLFAFITPFKHGKHTVLGAKAALVYTLAGFTIRVILKSPALNPEILQSNKCSFKKMIPERIDVPKLKSSNSDARLQCR